MPIFDPADTTTQVKTSIGGMQYDFNDANGTPEGITSTLLVTILDQKGEPMKIVRLRNVGNHMTATEKTRLFNLFVRLRAEAVKELLS